MSPYYPPVGGGALLAANNLSDLLSTATARSNIGLSGQWKPSDYGLIAWSYDPGASSNTGSLPTAGLIYRIRLMLDAAVSITNVVMHVAIAGATLTASQNWASIYQGGSLVGQTADQTTPWQSTGVKTMALTGGPFAVTAGALDIEFVSNGTTTPGFLRGIVGAAAQFNLSLSAANSRYGTSNAGTTTALPGTIGTITALGTNYFGAVS